MSNIIVINTNYYNLSRQSSATLRVTCLAKNIFELWTKYIHSEYSQYHCSTKNRRALNTEEFFLFLYE